MPFGEIGDQPAIEAAVLGEVDILDAGLAVAELGVAQSVVAEIVEGCVGEGWAGR